jgi:mannose-6-phosphate isomerase-like protein (cupin superfamily)
VKFKKNFYDKNIFIKPWGFEYVIFRNKKKVGITFLKILKGKKTSLHCHTKKKTGFIILSGQALVQVGLYKRNRKKYGPLSRLVFRPGLFHSLKAISKKGVVALEFESPFDKPDLVRFKDDYGRKDKPYEGVRFTRKLDKSIIKFRNTHYKNFYKFGNILVELKKTKKFTRLIKKDYKTSVSILDGEIKDRNGNIIISIGEVVRFSTLKILSKNYIVSKPIFFLQASRISL